MLVWLSTGMVLAALVVWGARVWPGVFLGVFIANLATGVPATATLGITAGNTLEGLVGAWLVNRFALGPRAFERPLLTVRFAFFAGMLATAIGAAVQAGSLESDWLTCWLNHMNGALIVTPLLVVWITSPPRRVERKRALEAAFLALSTLGAGQAVFGGWFQPYLSTVPLIYLCLPPLLWAAFRFHQRGATAVLLAFAVMAMWGTSRGHGPFAAGSQDVSLLLLQDCLGGVSIIMLPLAALASDRRRAQATLHERERAEEAAKERLRLVLDGALDAVVVADAQGLILDWNPQAAAIFGWPREEAVGRRIADTIVPPRYRQAHRRGLERLLASGLGPILNKRVELTAARRNGTEFPVELTVVPIRTQEGTLFSAFVRDITDRKRAQKQIEDLTETLERRIEERTSLLQEREAMLSQAEHIAHLGSWEWDITRNRVSWSDELYRIYGLDRGRFEATLEGYFERVHPDDRARVTAAIKRALRERGSFDHEERIVRPDGAVRLLHSRGQLVPGDAYRSTRMVGTCQDVTERREQEERDRMLFHEQERRREAEDAERRARFLAEENARLYRLAQRAISARDEFLSIASHELKTPLTALMLGLDVAIRTLRKTTPEPADLVEASKRHCLRLGKMIDELLDFTRIRMGRLKLELAETDLKETARAAAERFKGELAQKGIALTLRADRSVVGRWDGLRLDQVLTNLLSNAIKYGRGRPISLAVEQVGEVARMTVGDQGIGIAPEETARIFTPFERAATSRDYRGLGLGLYIVQQIVEAHGGRVDVHSVLGEGSTFTVELPLAHSLSAIGA